MNGLNGANKMAPAPSVNRGHGVQEGLSSPDRNATDLGKKRAFWPGKSVDIMANMDYASTTSILDMKKTIQ